MVVKAGENQNEQVKWKQVALKQGKRLVLISLAGLLWIQPVVGMNWLGNTASIVSAAESTQTGEEMITAGAKLVKYTYSTTRGNKNLKVLMDVIEVDLSNPYVQMDIMTGKNNQLTTRQTVQNMAIETGAVAGVNGDFFVMSGQGVPMGGAVSKGALVSSPAQLSGMYAFAVSKDGKPSIDLFRFNGSVTAEDGSTFPLAGINQESYKIEPDNTFSHVNNMFIYTSAWKSAERPKASSTTPTEVLVQGDVIQQISLQAPIQGTIPEGAYILRAHGTAADYITSHFSVGQRVSTSYQLVAQSSGQMVDPTSLQVMIGGHTLLVDEGKASSFTRSTSGISGGSSVARTAVGYSKDGTKAYMITAENNSGSPGLTLKELQNFMISIGVWKGMNLDGGGSTTMVSRPLAETKAELTFSTSNGAAGQRAVVNGLGVFSTAPQGTLKGLKVSGNTRLMIGESASYTLKGYDNYYNPIDTSNIGATWSASNSNLVESNGSFKAAKSGDSQVVATSNGVKTSLNVNVLGGKDLESLTPSTTFAPLESGTSINVPVTAKLKSTVSTVNVPAESIKWKFSGIDAVVSDGVLKINKVNSGVKIAYATPEYDGFSGTPIVLSTSEEQVWENFENVSYPFNFTGLPAGMSGSVSVVQGTGSTGQNSKVLKIDYDMTNGTGNRFAYAQFNGTTGKAIPAGATQMTIDVLGDSSQNWLRVEFEDANGKAIYGDLTKQIDSNNWKTLKLDLSTLNLKQPAKLKRIYLVNLEEGQDERALQGSISLDNIKFTAPASQGESSVNTGVTALMTIGKKTMTVNNSTKTLDVAPVLQNGVTYVPIKYILDSFGGSANWDKVNKKLTVIQGGTTMELTVNKREFLLGGVKKQGEAAPIILNSRTLVPLRLVSEQLGIQVKWEKITKSITLKS